MEAQEAEIATLQEQLNAVIGGAPAGEEAAADAQAAGGDNAQAGAGGRGAGGKGRGRGGTGLPSGWFNRLMAVVRAYNREQWGRVDRLINQEYMVFPGYESEWQRFNGLPQE